MYIGALIITNLVSAVIMIRNNESALEIIEQGGCSQITSLLHLSRVWWELESNFGTKRAEPGLIIQNNESQHRIPDYKYM